MKRTSVKDVNCSIAQCLEVIGDWWTPLIIRDLLLGAHRFDDLQERLGISRNVLAQRLDLLVENEIVRRRPYQEHPPRFDYVLTERGRDLWPILQAMKQWGDRWELPEGGTPVELVHDRCGHVTEVVPTCRRCGEELVIGSMHSVLGPGAGPEPLPPHLRPLPRR